MLAEFKNLTPDEQQTMFDAIPLITILVAAADNELDEVELREAQRLADIRSFNVRGRLTAYYEQIDQGLSQRIMDIYNNLPAGLEQREEILWQRLRPLNDILRKLPKPYDYLYYHSFHTFAKHVAEAHGGFLRFITVGPKEARVMTLPMIDRMEKPDEPEYHNLF